MSTYDLFTLLVVLIVAAGWLFICAANKLRVNPETKPKTFDEKHPAGVHEYRHAYGNWLKCIHCGKMLNKLDLVKKETSTSILPVLLLFFLFVGCSSPVTRLRAVSQNYSGLNVSRTIDNILNAAQNAAIQGDRYTIARFVAPELEIQKIVRQLLAIDRKFRIEVQPTELFTTLIIRW